MTGNNFFFVHINKTGGSSIEKALGIRFQHKPARLLIREHGIDAWRNAFTFSIVRNPWDKVISHYHYRIMTNETGLREKGITFGEWVAECYGHRNPEFYNKPLFFMPQLDWLTGKSGRILVNYVGRFENLSNHFAEICRHIGIVEPRLPHVKQSLHDAYWTYYDDATIEIVHDWFRKDIEAFGYEF